MSSLYPHFPRELRSQPLRGSDATFAGVFALLSLLLVPTVLLLRTLPAPPVPGEQRRELLRVIYRPPPARVERPALRPQTQGRRPESRPQTDDRPPPAPAARGLERGQMQSQQRQRSAALERREAARQVERSERELRSTGIFAVAGSRAPAAPTPTADALALEAGSIAGRRAGQAERIVTRGSAEVEQLRRQRELLRELEGGEEIGADRASFELPALRLDGLPRLRAVASPELARDEAVLRAAIEARLPSLQRCYLVYRERDPGLAGSLLLRLTVLPDGSVEKVQMRRRAWSNPAAGRRVESCIERTLLGWSFDPAEGEPVTLELPLLLSI